VRLVFSDGGIGRKEFIVILGEQRIQRYGLDRKRNKCDQNKHFENRVGPAQLTIPL